MSELSLELIENITKLNDRLMGTSPTIRALSRKIKNNTATLQDAYRYAREVGNIRKKTLKNVIDSEKLPDGRMYYNIANDVVNDSLKKDHKTVAEFAKSAQRIKNQSMKLGLEPLEEEVDQENIDSIIDAVSSDEYNKVSTMFGIMCATFVSRVVDRSIYKNASYQNKIGIKIIIERTGGANCCPWCEGLTGSWPIDQAPDDVRARHDNCSCSVDYSKR